MELKEFIKETLIQLTEGVKEAQKECLKSDGLINPLLKVPISNSDSFEFKDKHYPSTEVKFKVGLTESTKDINKVGVGVFLSAISLGGESKGEIGIQSITSIEFSINTVMPFLNRQGKVVSMKGMFY